MAHVVLIHFSLEEALGHVLPFTAWEILQQFHVGFLIGCQTFSQ